MPDKKWTKFPPKKPEVFTFKAQPKRDWSDYQKEIFRDISKGTGHTVVIARAGSAKTSSLVEGSKYIPKGKKSLFCAFNKHIQEELKLRLGSYIECLTLHSLGFRGIKQRFGNVELDNDKCWNIVEEIVGNNFDLIDNICQTVDFCKSNLVDTPSQIEELICQYDIDLCETPPETFIKHVCQALRLCKEKTNIIDFNDMIYFPFVYRINVGKYDYVFIDEAQDLSKAQIELALSASKIDGRIIAVLDPRQAIYSWRGADTKVLENFKSRFSPKELTLPICYRCPKSVVALAQTIVPDIMPYEKSPEGEIIEIDIENLQKYAKPGSYVLSRTNAPLIKHCMRFLKNSIPANILGRDIGNGLLYLIKKSKKKKVSDLLKWVVEWEKQEKENLLIKYPKANTDFITDKAECINMLCEDAASLEEVKENIANLFKDNDEKSIVLFSSIHKIKGKEADIVFVLADTLRASNEEELNIKYVAFTRAKSKLYLARKAIKTF
jgi:DNA helicase II / ATP-dependent DNA helicase PcrA